MHFSLAVRGSVAFSTDDLLLMTCKQSDSDSNMTLSKTTEWGLCTEAVYLYDLKIMSRSSRRWSRNLSAVALSHEAHNRRLLVFNTFSLAGRTQFGLCKAKFRVASACINTALMFHERGAAASKKS